MAAWIGESIDKHQREAKIKGGKEKYTALSEIRRSFLEFGREASSLSDQSLIPLRSVDGVCHKVLTLVELQQTHYNDHEATSNV